MNFLSLIGVLGALLRRSKFRRFARLNKARLVMVISAIVIAGWALGVMSDRAIAQLAEAPAPTAEVTEVTETPEELPIEVMPPEVEPPTDPVTPPVSQPKQKGMSYVTWSTNGYTDYEAESSLTQLRSTGADWISLLVTQYQDTITSTTIYAESRTPTDSALAYAIAQAHQLGFKVMLKPHLDLAKDPTHWRGQIGAEFTEADWETWFAAYQTLINRYAQVAQTYGADQFTVGTELQATEGQADRWRAVIANVRQIYTGPITYAGNWDNEGFSWWDAVDYIGIDAYLPLTDRDDPTVDELKATWAPYVAKLADLAATWNKPILFTEVGYRSQNGANRTPWEWKLNSTVDLQEQADCYQAIFESVFDQPWFAGIYLWFWAVTPEGGPYDQGYTPRDKPAEAIMRQWYGG